MYRIVSPEYKMPPPPKGRMCDQCPTSLCRETRNITKVFAYLLLSFLCLTNLSASSLVVNELSLYNSTYIELYNMENKTATLSDYAVVLFNDTTNSAYDVITFNNTSVVGHSYFIISREELVPNVSSSDMLLHRNLHLVDDGVYTVALYRIGNGLDFNLFYQSLTVPDGATILDSVVFSGGQNNDSTPVGQIYSNASFVSNIQGWTSISLCTSSPGMDQHFWNEPMTPGLKNHCPEISMPRLSENDTDSTTVAPTTNSASAETISQVSSTPEATTTPEPVRKIVINEVYVDPPTLKDEGEFVELLEVHGRENVPLDGLFLVFWNGAYNPPRSSNVINLTGHVTGPGGYFLLGSFNLSTIENVTVDMGLPSIHAIQNGPLDAVCLYEIDDDRLVKVANLTGQNLTDSLVYFSGGVHNPPFRRFQVMLTGGQKPVHFAPTSGHTCLVRCYSNEPNLMGAFTAVNTPTPRVKNTCNTLPKLHINEFKFSSTAANKQFIEIRSPAEIPVFPLDDMYLVTFDGTTKMATGVFNLTNGKTDNSSFYLIDSDNMPSQDLPGAIVVYWSPNKVMTVNTTKLTNISVVDAVVCGSNRSHADPELVTVLLQATQVKQQVDLTGLMSNQSVSYCPHSADHPIYGITSPTPNGMNDCPLRPTVSPAPVAVVKISEVYIDPMNASLNFIELWGDNGTNLTDWTVVFYGQELGNAVLGSLDLYGHSIGEDVDGLLLINSSGLLETGLLVSNSTEPLAVTLYNLPASEFNNDTALMTGPRLRDFVVCSRTRPDLDKNTEKSLMTLLGGAGQMEIWYPTSEGESMTRCRQDTKTQWSYWLMPLTPGLVQNCTPPKIMINEINADNPGIDNAEFLELYHRGNRSVSLSPYVLVSFNGANVTVNKAFPVHLWNERTDDDGFFLLGITGQNLPSQADKNVTSGSAGNFFQNKGPDAIALYSATPTHFNTSSQPIQADLVDVVVYAKDNSKKQLIAGLIDALNPGGQIVVYDTPSGTDVTMSRCQSLDKLSPDSYKDFQLATPTPRANNNCTSVPSTSPPTSTASTPPVTTTGTTTASSNVTTAGHVTPQSNTSTPQSNTSTPQSNTSTPQSNTSTPQSNTSTPQSNTSTPESTSNGSTTLQTTTPSPKPLTKLYISELNVDQNGHDNNEFIELKGDKSANMTGYLVVLFNGSDGTSYKTFSLDGKSTDTSGYLLIAHKGNMKPTPQVTITHDNVLRWIEVGGVALYDARPWGGQIKNGTNVSATGLVDAIVYTSSNYTAMGNYSISNILTPQSRPVSEVPSSYTSDESINRCRMDIVRNSSVYALAAPTPKADNLCPDPKYSNDINFKLIDAKYDYFEHNYLPMLRYVTELIVDHVNSKCKCGFSPFNVIDAEFVRGSVIMTASIISFSQNHSDEIVKHYKEFVTRTPKVKINGMPYQVDTKCLTNCVPPPKPSGLGGDSSNVTVAVVVSCIVVFLFIVIIVIIYMKRKKRGILHFRMARFDAEDEHLTMDGDMDDFADNSEQASFKNPLYFKS